MKKIFFTAFLYGIGFGCLIAFNLIGSKVMPDGTLIEPFALIPMGYLFIMIGIIATIILVVKKKK